jgi:hypothetical protein
MPVFHTITRPPASTTVPTISTLPSCSWPSPPIRISARRTASTPTTAVA